MTAAFSDARPFPPAAMSELPTRDAVPTLDAARERVVRLLTDRYADDTLTVEEFEEQLDRLHATHDVASLDAMAWSLQPSRAAAPRADATTAPAPYAPSRAPARPLIADATRLLAVMGSAKRRGAWHLPAHMQAVTVMGEVVLDLRDVLAESDESEIEVFALMGNLKIIVPPGVETRVEVGAFMAQVDDRTEGGRRLDYGYDPVRRLGPRRVRVTGQAIMAEVKVVTRE